jgi:putative sigma-54 modulation protein
MESTPSIKDYVVEKLQKVKKYLNEPVEANVVLSTEKFRQTVDISLSGDSGAVINGVESQEDMYAAIDTVMDKIERQVKKQLDKQKHQKAKSSNFKMHVLASVREEDEEDAAEGSAPQIIRSTSYSTKPMSVEEATEQLRASRKEFVIFTNAATGAVNVVYYRKDGNYGLIEPE